MTVAINWVKWHDYSAGVGRQKPPTKVEKPEDETLHMDCAVWLASQVEAAAWGTVQSYDGLGMSAGLIHNTLLTRGNDQGSLPLLLRDLELAHAPVERLYSALAAHNLYVARDGVIRDTKTGVKVSATILRDIFTPPKGVVPNKGPEWEQAKFWLTLFSDLFAHPKSRRAQVDFAARWMAGNGTREEFQVYRTFTGMTKLDSPIGLKRAQLPEEVDLAMSFYHAMSVNAPREAIRILRGILVRTPIGIDNQYQAAVFAQRLIRALGESQYGNWHDLPGDSSSRYDRVRGAARRFWRASLVDQLAPRDL